VIRSGPKVRTDEPWARLGIPTEDPVVAWSPEAGQEWATRPTWVFCRSPN